MSLDDHCACGSPVECDRAGEPYTVRGAATCAMCWETHNVVEGERLEAARQIAAEARMYDRPDRCED